MEIKWFFVIIGMIFVGMMLAGIYFIASNISTQSYIQYQNAQNQSKQQYDNATALYVSNFNRSVLIHEAIFRNITDIKNGLDPVFNIIGNATEQKAKQDLHYNQTTADFQSIKDILVPIKLQDHELLLAINKTLSELSGGNKNISGPNPIIINNGTPVPVDNSTG